jgi:hypothetical protein
MDADAEDFCVRGAVEDVDDSPTGEVAGGAKSGLIEFFGGVDLEGVNLAASGINSGQDVIDDSLLILWMLMCGGAAVTVVFLR